MDYNLLSEEITRLVKIMERLRGENGCPWDRKQNYYSLKGYILEEAYEVVEALENEDIGHLKEELGDLLLQVVFESQIAKENKDFDLIEVIKNINKKLIKRHPHVFENLKLKTAEEVKETWDKIKEDEKRNTIKGIDDYDKGQPSLNQAYEIQENAKEVGFDWDESISIIEKLEEELSEIKEAIKNNEKEEIKNEIGDIIFSAVNLSRFYNINPELAVFSTIIKFKKRFKFMEKEAEKNNIIFSELSLEEMEKYWKKAKLEFKEE